MVWLYEFDRILRGIVGQLSVDVPSSIMLGTINNDRDNICKDSREITFDCNHVAN